MSYKEVPKMARLTKSVAEERLGDASQEEQFWCHDGRYLKSLEELEVALEQMTEETFRYHSNEAKSDFSNWVRDVIGDEKLSRDLQKSTTQAQAAKSVADRVIWLKGKIACL
jgi:hypothetical protein